MTRRLAATDRTPRLRAEPSSPVYVVADDVVRQALELADGDRRRLEVLGTDAVLVRNRPRPR